MDAFIRAFTKRLFLTLVCSAVVIILLVRELKGGFLSERGFVIGVLLVGVGATCSALIIGARTFKHFSVIPSPTQTLDEATRRRRLFAIRAGKAMVVLLTIALVSGLIRGGPFLPVTVGIVMNLGMTVSLIWWIARLQRSLK